MKRSYFILAVVASLILGGVIASSGFYIGKNSSKSHAQISDYSGYANLHFTNDSEQQHILPDFTMAAEKGVRSVVNIDVIKRVAAPSRGSEMDFFDYFFGNPQGPQGSSEPQYREQRGGGSGVIISADGYIVSNNHVVNGADQIKVTTSEGEYYTAKVVGIDPATDIALLKIEGKNLTPLEFGDSDRLRLGEWVLAVGNPYGLTSTVTQGIISAKGRSMGMSHRSQLEIESFIQTDAVVNAGNSGGALITLDGRLIGINTFITSRTGSYEGYSFAIPSAIVRKVVADIMEHGVVQRALLGISMGEITAEWVEQFGEETGVKERGGLYIGEVLEGGAAEKAGIQKGDILTAINGVKTNTSAEVQETIGRLRPNDKIQVSIKRDGKVKHLDVILRNKAGGTDVVTKKSFDLAKELGGNFRDLNEAQQKKLNLKYGVQVTAIGSNGLLARARVRVGFIITAINDIPLQKASQIETINIENIEAIEGIYPDGSRATYIITPQK